MITATKTEEQVQDQQEPTQPIASLSYFDQRMSELGITPEINQIEVEFDCFDDTAPRRANIFSESPQGGIEILYVGLAGLKTYQKGRKELPYVRTRLHPDQVANGLPKYLTPRGAGTHVFIPPLVLNTYHRGQAIETLIITEGEFKAFKATMHGLFCVGVQGIHNTGEKDERGNVLLNSEIAAIIKNCQVRNVVFLLDNDCLTVTYEKDKDLGKRPHLFFKAVENFRELLKPYECDVYFSHLHTDQPHKGLDDMLCAETDNVVAVVEELLRFQAHGQRFETQNITIKGLKALRAYFHITNPATFYEQYRDEIGDQQFIYAGSYYEHDGEELKALVKADVNCFVRVGDDYYKQIQKTDKHGKTYPQLLKRRKETISDDYGRIAFKFIQKCEDFCLVPSHHNYQRYVGNCYNSYHQISHQPQPGPIDHSLFMVRHIFKDKYEFGLDYLQLLYMEPDQLLPILLLQSKERETGKSSFGQWLIEIYQANAVKLGNQDLESDFNSTYAERLLIVVDETTISKKITSEAIKRMSTEVGKIWVNAKNRQQYEADWIGKFIFITNTIGTALYIGKGETRYFVRTVSPLPKPLDAEKEPILGEKDPGFMGKLRDEIPAFLHFLQYRTLHHARRGRMYFDFSDFRTPELGDAIQSNTSSVEREIRQLLTDTFGMFTDEAVLQFSLNDLERELEGGTRYRVNRSEIRHCLKEELGVVPTKQGRYTYHSYRDSLININTTYERNGKPYTFDRETFGNYE